MEEITGKIPSIVDRGKKMLFGINIIYSVTSDSFLVLPIIVYHTSFKKKF